MRSAAAGGVDPPGKKSAPGWALEDGSSEKPCCRTRKGSWSSSPTRGRCGVNGSEKSRPLAGLPVSMLQRNGGVMANRTQARQLGDWAEQRALELLQARGWELLSRQWRCRWGELDLVLAKSRRLLVVEVKGRRRAGPDGWGQGSLGAAKRAKIDKAWSCWLAGWGGLLAGCAAALPHGRTGWIQWSGIAILAARAGSLLACCLQNACIHVPRYCRILSTTCTIYS